MEYIKITKVIKTGTSLCVVVPKDILRACGIVRGDHVVWSVAGDNILILRKINDVDISKLKLPTI